MIKFKALVQDFLNFCCLNLRDRFIVGLHLEFNIQIAVGLVCYVDAQGLAETNSDRAKV